MGLKCLRSKENFGPKKFFVTQKLPQKNLWSKKILCPKKFWGSKNVRTKEICPIIKDNNNKGPKKNLSPKKCGVQKLSCLKNWF